MDQFRKRERAEEAHYALQEEVKFLINAKACHIFGQWLGLEKLCLNEADAADLEDLLVQENLKHGKVEIILDLASKTLESRHINADPIELRKAFTQARLQAKIEFSETVH